MKLIIIIALLALTVGLKAQTKDSINVLTGGLSTSSTVTPFAYWLSSGTLEQISGSDTTKVLMMYSKVPQSEKELSIPVMFMYGYSVMPRLNWWDLPRAYYLDIDKKPLPGNVIVWMSATKP